MVHRCPGRQLRQPPDRGWGRGGGARRGAEPSGWRAPRPLASWQRPRAECSVTAGALELEPAMSTDARPSDYPLARTAAEFERLDRQRGHLAPMAAAMLDRIGVAPG